MKMSTYTNWLSSHKKNLRPILSTLVLVFLGFYFTTAQVSGKVYQDFNANGASGSADFGYQGITVRAFDSNGNLLGTATTDVNGNYSIPVASGVQVRIEFSNLPAGYYSGPYGSFSGTAVQFTTGGTSNVNLGINDPDNYCQDNPKLYTPVWTNGNPLGGGNAGTTCALFQYNYTDNGANPNPSGAGPNATCSGLNSQTGALFGLAYQKSTNKLFSSAVLRRHAGFGPLGIGGIYVTSNASGGGSTTASYVNVSNLGINLGADPHTGLPSDKTQPNTDPNAYCATGKRGIGDIDISDDGSKLFIVNLFERKVHEITIGNPAVAGNTLTSANVRSWSIPHPGCSNGDFVPWGLKFYKDKLYVGIVCTGETSQNWNDLVATVYELNPATGVFTNVISTTTFPNTQRWFSPWNCNGWQSHQSILSDIEFDERGNMTVAMMDRISLQWGRQNLPPGGGSLEDGYAAGNIHKLCYNATTNRFTLENNAVVCGVTGFAPNNGQGPGGGEFYDDEGNGYPHEEVGFGALATRLGSGEIIWTAEDPVNTYAGGIYHNNTSTGQQTGVYYELYQSVDVSTFGKAGGIGDVEVLCNIAPLEIGNRVWMDTDGDGIQDANEMGLAGVSVQLYKNGTLVGTSVTTSTGQYLFNNSNVTGGLLPSMAYEIRIPNFTTQAGLSGKSLTTTDVNGNADDQRDNDGTVSGTNVIANITTGISGDNNHTYDFGFKSCATTVNAGSDVSICPGGSTTLTANGANGTAPYTYTWSNGLGTGQSKTVSPTSTTTYTVTVTDNLNCTSTDQVIVTVNSSPVANAGTDVTICNGSSTTLTANGTGGAAPYTFNWNNGLGAGQTKTVNPTTTTTYTVTVSDSKNCTATDQVIVTVNPRPTVTINKTDASCGIANGSATANPTGGTSPYTSYSWSNGGTTQTINNLPAGSYTVTVTDSKGCTGTATTTINNTNGVNVNAGADREICNGSSTTLTATPSNGTSPFSYTWSNGMTGSPITVSPTVTTTYTVTVSDANSCTATDQVIVTVNARPNVTINKTNASCGIANGTATANPTGGTSPYTSYSWSNGGTTQTINNLAAGSYTVTVTDSKGCTAAATTNITMTPSVSVNAGADREICNGSSTTLTATPSGGASPYSYAWSNGMSGSPITVSPTATTTYTVTITDANNCTGTDQVVVTVNNRPTVTINKTNASCGIANGTATANPSGGTSPYISYAWSNGGNTQTINNLAAGTYTVTVTDSKGCTGTAVTTITMTPAVTVNAGADRAICYGSSTTLTASPSAGTSPFTYTWSNGMSGSPITVSPTVTTTYTVTISDANNCTGTDQVTVTVNNNPIANAGADQSICFGKSTTISASGSSGTPPYNYTWSNGLGTGATKTVSPTVQTTYTVTISDQNGCTDTDQMIVYVNPNPIVNAGADQSTCIGTAVTLTANATNGSAPYTYNWDNGLGAGQIKTVNPIVTTTYTVTATDNNGCTNTDQVMVTVNAKPSSGIRAPSSVCALEGAVFEAFPPVTGASYSWTTDGGTPATSTADNFSVSWSTSYIGTTRNVRLTVTDANGCTSTYVHPINVTQNPVANAGPDKEICEGGSTTIGGNPSGPAGSSFLWTPNLYLNSNTVANPVATPPVTTTYTLTSTINGCTRSDQITITVNTLLNPTVSATANPDPICAGKTSTLTATGNPNGGRGGPFQYVWNNGLGAGAIKTTPALNTTTTYTVTVIDAAQCTGTNTVTVDVTPCGSIGDYVWIDTDGDGVQDATETGLNGVTVLLKDNVGNTIATQVTRTGPSGPGYYLFPDLFANQYIVMVMKPTGYEFTDDNSVTSTDNNDSDVNLVTGNSPLINLGVGENITNIDAGLYQPASLGNYVWEDLNKNGVQDAGEPGVNGVTVLLKNAAGTTLQTTVTTTGPTGTAGYYQFTNLAPGDYIVMFMAPTGYKITTQDATGDTQDSDANTLTGNTVVTNLVSGESDQTWDAGIFRPATIGDYVWRDTDGDGVQDPTEAGINGVTVLLKDASGNTVQTTVTTNSPTGQAGYYSFTVDPGTYTVMFMAPTGNTFSPTGQGTTATDSDPNPLTGNSTPVTVTSGSSNTTIDAGLYQPASLGNYVWEDLNKNGVQDAGEPGVNGVTVLLKNAAGTTLQTTTTTNSPTGTAGYYQFTNLAPGDYMVMFMAPTGYKITTQDATGDTQDSDANSTTGNTVVTNLVSGESDQTWDAGIFRPATIGDYVWRDADADGVQDPTETGINGVTVLLKDASGNTVQTTVTTNSPTGQAGYYSFTVDPGTYTVMFMSPTGLSLSPTGQGTAATDSDPNPLTGNSNPVTVTSGSSNTTIDAGLKCNATVSAGADQVICNGTSITLVATGSNGVAPYNYVWNNPSSTGSTKNITPTTTTVYTVTVTDNIGCTSTDMVTVTVNPLPTVQINGTSPICNGSSTTLTATGGVSYVWNTGSTSNSITVSPTTTTTYTVTATDANGCTNTGTKTVIVNQNPVVSAGADQFVCPGTTVSLSANANGGAAPYTFNWDNSLGSGQTKSVTPSNTTTYTVTVIDGNQCSNTDQVVVNIIQCGTIGNYVWEDTDGDGVQDPTETGINGVTVILRDGLGNPIPGKVAITTTSPTGQPGWYEFTNLPAGNYTLSFSQPTGFTFTVQNSPTGTAATNSDVNSTGVTAVIPLAQGETNLNIDAGLYRTASLGNYVWFDTDRDGVQDGTETGLNGFTVNLYNSSGTLLQTKLTSPDPNTGANGYYLFTNLAPGSYYISVISPVSLGYATTVANNVVTATETTDSDINGAFGPNTSSAVSLASGQTYLDLDAGFYLNNSIGDYVWIDADRDGVQDPTEVGINEITVILYNANGTVYGTKITTNNPSTGQAGWYEFTNLPVGNYYVKFDIPSTYIVTTPNATTDNLDSDVTGANGTNTTSLISILANTNNRDVDAGIFACVKIGNFVWNDIGTGTKGSVGFMNGIQDGTELGQANVTVNLRNSNGSIAQTTTTKSNGEYEFCVAPGGSYYLEFIPPSGYVFTLANVSGNTLDATDSDVNGTNGSGTTALFTVGVTDNFTYDAGIVNSALPLDLISFTGRHSNGVNELDWLVANEVNVNRYAVERRHSSEKAFTEVGSVTAVNSPVYDFADNNLPFGGTYYYRLRMIDLDGTYNYSNIIAINLQSKVQLNMFAYPNPAKTDLNVNINSETNDLIKVELMDLSGKVVYNQTVRLANNSNNEQIKIDIKQFNSGVYILRSTNKNKSLTEKITITH